MSLPPDTLDEQIRAALERTPRVAFDADTLVPGIRKRASARRRRRFAAAAGASTLALVLFVLGLTLRADPKVQVITEPPPTTAPSSTVPEYPFRELPLSDGPLADIPLTPVLTVGEHSLTVEVANGKLTHTLLLNGELSGSIPASDPQTLEGIHWSAGSTSSRSNEVFWGIARSEVDHFVVTIADQEIRVDAVALDRIPQVRFFLIEAPRGTFTDDQGFNVTAYDRDGTILTVDQIQRGPADERN